MRLCNGGRVSSRMPIESTSPRRWFSPSFTADDVVDDITVGIRNTVKPLASDCLTTAGFFPLMVSSTLRREAIVSIDAP